MKSLNIALCEILTKMKSSKAFQCRAAVFIIFVTIIGSSVSTLEVRSEDNALIAKTHLEKIQAQTKHLRYGECWTGALKILQAGCRRLTDEIQRRIAYAFTRCHLKASGRDIKECPEDVAISECTDGESMPDFAFNAYTEFFTHTQQICFHLQNQAWHEATENTISRLADNSEDVATRLEQSSNVAKEMMAQQNLSLKNQEILLQNEQRLKDSMDRSVSDVQRSHAETKAIISEQRELFSEVFDRVAVLQKTVLGEFSSIYTFGFYIGSTLIAYIVTSTTRTGGARIWMFLILMCNAGIEHLITQYYLRAEKGGTSFSAMSEFIPELIYEQTWLCRKISCSVALFIWLICMCMYKDYTRINNRLLNDIKRDIKQHNEALQVYIKQNIQSEAIEPARDITMNHDETLGKQMIMEKYQSGLINVPNLEIASVSDETLCPSISDGEQSQSVISDCTYRESKRCDNSEVSSVASFVSVSSRSTISGTQRNLSQSHMTRHSTPLRELKKTPVNEKKSSSKYRRRKSEIVTLIEENELSHCESPSDSVVVGGYNLRRRSTIRSINSSILIRESADDFENLVHNLAEKSAARRFQISQMNSQQN